MLADSKFSGWLILEAPNPWGAILGRYILVAAIEAGVI
jgi:hypothetical protein